MFFAFEALVTHSIKSYLLLTPRWQRKWEALAARCLPYGICRVSSMGGSAEFCLSHYFVLFDRTVSSKGSG
jgi:hypothetical protein